MTQTEQMLFTENIPKNSEKDSGFYDEAYFLGTTENRGAFSLLELGPKFQDRTQTVVDYFDLPHAEPGTVIEAGCGTAPFSRLVSENPALEHIQVVATDITESGINLVDPGERPPFQAAGAEELPVEDNSLLGIVEWDVLEHMDHPEQALEEAYRALRPDGFLHIICPNPESWLRDAADPDKDPYHRDKSHVFPPIVTVDFLDEQLQELGFKYDLLTRGFEGSDGQSQTGLAAMRPAHEDKTGTHIVAFVTKS